MSFAFESSNGGVSEFASIDSLQDAVQAAEGILAAQGIEEPVWAEQADADGTNDDGEQCWRLLCWASEADADGDAGASAIGQLTWICD